MDITVVGSCMTDLVSYVPRLPVPGETLHGHKFNIGFGGKGANQCIAASRLGSKTAMVAKVGCDTFGQNYLNNFKQNGIISDYVTTTSDAMTGAAPIFVDDKGQNSIVIVAGANLKLSVHDINAAKDIIIGSKVLITQLEIKRDVTLEAMKIAKQAKVILLQKLSLEMNIRDDEILLDKDHIGLLVTTIFNPAPAVEYLQPEFYTLSDYFCPNETETEILTGIKAIDRESIQAACNALLDKGCKNVILTMGDQGAAFCSQNNRTVENVTVEKVKVVDTTGAGDSFIGSLAFYLSNMPHLSLSEIVKRCCRIASVSVTAEGTQTSFPKQENLEKELFD
ncbi:DgyrCDS439 [Dimorphilus gyrociliatus]|uniref:Ribokinase n=1 Tax=Dimorphilus gyrociliatus TaxID=2664684 RepID=A0A7I8V5T2_9ANNE|nr:DgyrCDS439 [Dimorphilus gyrociliatus]